jgi:hypothetical protein
LSDFFFISKSNLPFDAADPKNGPFLKDSLIPITLGLTVHKDVKVAAKGILQRSQLVELFH